MKQNTNLFNFHKLFSSSNWSVETCLEKYNYQFYNPQKRSSDIQRMYIFIFLNDSFFSIENSTNLLSFGANLWKIGLLSTFPFCQPKISPFKNKSINVRKRCCHITYIINCLGVSCLLHHNVSDIDVHTTYP